ncbi:MAG: hypothetical protein PQ964_06065 [Methanobacteriaceae archaeon]
MINHNTCFVEYIRTDRWVSPHACRDETLLVEIPVSLVIEAKIDAFSCGKINRERKLL